jgi:hypothetical protein
MFVKTSSVKPSGNQTGTARSYKTAGRIFTVLGVLLLLYFTKKAGMTEVVEGIRRLGAGFLLVLATHGLKLMLRALAWMSCFETARAIRFRDAFTACVVGDALGNLIPFGAIVSEPAKALLVRDRVPFIKALSAVVIENIFLSFAVIIFLFSGTAVLLFGFPLPKSLRIACIVTIGVAASVTLGSFVVLRRRWKFASKALNYLYARGIAQNFLEIRRARASDLEDSIYGFYARNPKRFFFILLLQALYQLTGVLDAYLILFFLTGSLPNVLTAFLLESVHVLINIAFTFVPMRAGVDEAGAGWLASTLHFSTATGVTLAIIRKGRELCWIAFGAALLARRGLSMRSVAAQAAAAGDQPALLQDAQPKNTIAGS